MLQAELEQQFHDAMQVYVSGQLEQAARAFAEITQRWPACVEAWFQRAEIAEQQQQFSDAVTYYEQVLEQQPDIQEAWFRLGTIAAQQQAEALALKYWQQALSINPDYAEAHLHLGLLCAQQPELEHQNAATLHFSRACVLSSDLMTLLSLARTLLWQNKQAVVAPLLDAILKHLKVQAPEPKLQRQWREALTLSLQLAHEQRDDDVAWQLLEQSEADAQLKQVLKAIYLSLEASPEAQQSVKDNLEQLAPVEGLSLAQAPRLLAWQKYGLQSRVNTYLLGASSPPLASTASALPVDKHPILKLVCLMHESALSLWPIYLQHLRSLPPRTWQIHLVLCHGLTVPTADLKAQIHRAQPATLLPLLQKISPDLLIHAGSDRQSTAVATALACRSLAKPSLSWSLYGPEQTLWQDTPEDPCFTGVLLLKSLQDPLQNALHLHRWSVYLQHHLRHTPGV
jgi:tetratricopeptide (TPR) repeat protein